MQSGHLHQQQRQILRKISDSSFIFMQELNQRICMTECQARDCVCYGLTRAVILLGSQEDSSGPGGGSDCLTLTPIQNMVTNSFMGPSRAQGGHFVGGAPRGGFVVWGNSWSDVADGACGKTGMDGDPYAIQDFQVLD